MTKRIRYSRNRSEPNYENLKSANASARGKQLDRHAKPWKSVTKPITVGAGNKGDWMSPRLKSSKQSKKKIHS